MENLSCTLVAPEEAPEESAPVVEKRVQALLWAERGRKAGLAAVTKVCNAF